jgi:hypothetical protein
MTNTDHTPPPIRHSPEPWDCDSMTVMYATPDKADELHMIEIRANVTEAAWDTVAFIEAIWPGAHGNARRIVAAVNACAGINTDALQHGIVRELHEALSLCWHQLSLWVRDVETCDLSPEDAEALEKANAVLAKANGGA